MEEADILKNDGSTLYFVPALGKTIQIIAPRPAGSMKVLSQISIPQESNKEVTVSELYVQGNRLIAICRLTNPSGSTVYNAAICGLRMPVYQGDARILIYNIGDRSAPKLERTYTQDGGILSTRMIGSTLYLITQYTVTQDENGTFIDLSLIHISEPTRRS